jgi:hypothetical protein
VRFLAGTRRQESTCSERGGTIWGATHGLHTQNIPVELGTDEWVFGIKTDMMNTYIAATIFTHIFPRPAVCCLGSSTELSLRCSIAMRSPNVQDFAFALLTADGLLTCWRELRESTACRALFDGADSDRL